MAARAQPNAQPMASQVLHVVSYATIFVFQFLVNGHGKRLSTVTQWNHVKSRFPPSDCSADLNIIPEEPIEELGKHSTPNRRFMVWKMIGCSVENGEKHTQMCVWAFRDETMWILKSDCDAIISDSDLTISGSYDPPEHWPLAAANIVFGLKPHSVI